ncbi:hypothetical protein BDQ17DRAFT_878252 [Cyathus striatus]|nr:hypothetical protein BDQ17DRAFT_878252 [Cyathus striatus]
MSYPTPTPSASGSAFPHPCVPPCLQPLPVSQQRRILGTSWGVVPSSSTSVLRSTASTTTPSQNIVPSPGPFSFPGPSPPSVTRSSTSTPSKKALRRRPKGAKAKSVTPTVTTPTSSPSTPNATTYSEAPETSTAHVRKPRRPKVVDAEAQKDKEEMMKMMGKMDFQIPSNLLLPHEWPYHPIPEREAKGKRKVGELLLVVSKRARMENRLGTPSYEDAESNSQAPYRAPVMQPLHQAPAIQPMAGYATMLSGYVFQQTEYQSPEAPVLGVAGDMDGYRASIYSGDILQNQVPPIQAPSTMVGYSNANFGYYNMSQYQAAQGDDSIDPNVVLGPSFGYF